MVDSTLLCSSDFHSGVRMKIEENREHKLRRVEFAVPYTLLRDYLNGHRAILRLSKEQIAEVMDDLKPIARLYETDRE